jgi:hypothetical protein
VAETFSQMFCSIAPCAVGGRVVAGQRLQNCLVNVTDTKLIIVQAPERLVASMLCTEVKIITPLAVRKIGTAVVLRMPLSPLFAVEFDGVYRRQRMYAEGKTSLLRQLFSIRDITRLPEAMRLGRQLASDFSAALLAAGAIDKRDAALQVAREGASQLRSMTHGCGSPDGTWRLAAEVPLYGQGFCLICPV